MAGGVALCAMPPKIQALGLRGIYKRHPPTNRRLGDGDPRGEKERRIQQLG